MIARSSLGAIGLIAVFMCFSLWPQIEGRLFPVASLVAIENQRWIDGYVVGRPAWEKHRPGELICERLYFYVELVDGSIVLAPHQYVDGTPVRCTPIPAGETQRAPKDWRWIVRADDRCKVVAIRASTAHRTFGPWKVETESIPKVQAKGLSDKLLKVGTTVTVQGWPARDGSPALGLKAITLPGGKVIAVRNTPR